MHHGYNEGMIPQPPGSPNPFATGFHHAYRRDHNLAGVGSGSPTVLFAKRKRNIFKGPMLSFGNRNASGSASNSARHASSSGASGGSGSGSHSRSASASGLGRRSGELAITVEEEEGEEDDVGRPSLGLGVGLGMGVSLGMSMAFAGIGGVGELHENVKEGDEDDEIEEVEVFSPVVTRPGERVEEHIFEEGEEVVDKVPSAVATTSGGGEGDRGKQHATTLTNAATTSDVAPVPVANPMSAAVPIIRMPMVGRSASGTAGNGGGASTTTAAASMAAASS